MFTLSIYLYLSPVITICLREIPYQEENMCIYKKKIILIFFFLWHKFNVLSIISTSNTNVNTIPVVNELHRKVMCGEFK